MNNDDLPITLVGDEPPDSFDTFLWWAFVALSCMGAASMLGLIFAALSWAIRRAA